MTQWISVLHAHMLTCMKTEFRDQHTHEKQLGIAAQGP